MKNILVGVDFHEKTELLLDKAAALAKPYQAKIWLLHAAAPDPDFVGYEGGPQFIRDERAEVLRREHRELLDFVNQLKAKEIEAEGLLIKGPTIEVMLTESKKLEIDLIIVGHHDHSFLYSVFFGSRSSEIIKKSEIPVMVVPFGE